MSKLSFNILRIGTAITFIWIGFLILKTPEAWGGYLQPWAVKLLPAPIAEVMTVTGILDICLGACLLFNILVWIAALLAALHIVIILVTSGITDVTVRDIAILAGTIALLIESLPENYKNKLYKHESR